MQKKILIVDDEKDVLYVLGKRLSDAGYFVIRAEGGKDAIMMAKNNRPNLILLDIIMPDIDGGEVVQILKKDPDTKDIPIIFLSCLFTKNDERQGHESGNNFFIAKPYNPEELLREVKKRLAPSPPRLF